MYLKNNQIQIDRETWLYEPNRRDDYRVLPAMHSPVIFHLQDKAVDVLNISAGGVAFVDPTLCEGGQYLGSLKLRHPMHSSIQFNVEVKAVRVIESIVRGCFIGLGEAEQAAIHQYVLLCQIAEIRQKKSALNFKSQ